MNDPESEENPVSEDTSRPVGEEENNEHVGIGENEIVSADSTEPEVSSEVQNDSEGSGSETGGHVEARSTDFWKDRNDDERTELDDEMRMVLKRIREVYVKEEIVQVPSLKARERRVVNKEVRLVNGVIHNVEVKTVTEVNKLLYAGSFVVAERLGLMKERNVVRNKKKELWWKRRIEQSIVKWKADLSRAEEVMRGVNVNKEVRERLGHRTCKTRHFIGFGTERARLGTFRGFCAERARQDTFRGFGTDGPQREK